MFLGTNLQYLRRQNDGMTQEKLAQQMGVSRQTVSKWESGEALPEIGNLLELAEIFSCKLDDLLRVDLSASADTSVRLVTVKPFRYAQYIMISVNAQQDVLTYMERWAGENGLQNPNRYIHWGFPYVTAEQKKRFGFSGHGAAYILPDDFASCEESAEIRMQNQATYAMLSVSARAAEHLMATEQMISKIMEYLGGAGIAKSAEEGFLPCFVRECEKDSQVHKAVFVLCATQETNEIIDLKE